MKIRPLFRRGSCFATLTNAGTGENGAFRADETATFTITVTNTDNTTQMNVTVSESELLDAVIAAGEVYTINEAGQAVIAEMAPGDVVVVNATYTITRADIDSGVQLVNIARVVGSDSTTEPDPVQIPTEEPQTASITINKGTVDALNGEPIALTGAQFYVALFSDAALTQRIGDVAIIQLDGLASGTATFNGLPSGTYYIAETTADGIPIASGTYNGGEFVPDYPAGQTVTVASGANAAFNFNNSFLTLPEDYYQEKLLTVTKNVADGEGNPVNSAETFYAGIFADAAYTQFADNVAQNILPLQMNGGSNATATAELSLNPMGDTMFYITEVDANGTPVQNIGNFAYDATVSNAVLSLNRDSEDPNVTITNMSRNYIVDENAKSVKTGDETPILPFMMAMILAAGVMLILGLKRRRRDEIE